MSFLLPDFRHLDIKRELFGNCICIGLPNSLDSFDHCGALDITLHGQMFCGDVGSKYEKSCL